MPDPHAFPLWLNLFIFAAASVVVWLAGSRLASYAELLANRTGLGQAFVGVILLAAATSLPEIATTVTAASIGNPSLAVSNLFGGIALQTAILAVADRVSGQDALTRFVTRAVLLLEGLLLVVLLGVALLGVTVGEVISAGGVGVWPLVVLGVYLGGIYLLVRYRSDEQWRPVNVPDRPQREEEAESSLRDQYHDWSTWHLVLAFAAGSLAILVAGTAVARVGDALASQTGLGGSFVGATLVAVATSLPEVSTTFTAVRLGAYSLALSNIFGSNMLLPALLFPADVFYRAEPVLAAVDRSAAFGIVVGILTTLLYLIGLVERRNRTFAGFGLDSIAVLTVYAGSVVGLYLLR